MTTHIKFQTTKSLDSAQIEMEHMSSQHIWDDSEALILADGKIDRVSNPHLSNWSISGWFSTPTFASQRVSEELIRAITNRYSTNRLSKKRFTWMLLSSQIDAKKQQLGNMAHTSECPKMGYPRHFWPLKTREPDFLNHWIWDSRFPNIFRYQSQNQSCNSVSVGFKQFHSPSPIHHHVYGLPTIPSCLWLSPSSNPHWDANGRKPQAGELAARASSWQWSLQEPIF